MSVGGGVERVALDIVLGAVMGALGGLFGIGGGLIAIPVLGVVYGLDEQHAQGTSLVMVVPNVVLGTWAYYRRGRMDKRIALTLALSAVPATYAGAHLATHHTSGTLLREAFGAFTGALAVYFAFRALATGPTSSAGRKRRPLRWQLAALVGGAGGAVSGVFSVGGAIFAVPILSLWFGLPQTAAQGMGLALVAPGTFVNVATYALARDVDWGTGIPLALGGVTAVSWGVALAHRLPERGLKLLFSLFLAASSIALLTHA